jgi:hypothetical protein
MRNMKMGCRLLAPVPGTCAIGHNWKSCQNGQLFNRKACIQIVERAVSENWEIIQLATRFDVEAHLWHPLLRPAK